MPFIETIRLALDGSLNRWKLIRKCDYCIRVSEDTDQIVSLCGLSVQSCDIFLRTRDFRKYQEFRNEHPLVKYEPKSISLCEALARMIKSETSEETKETKYEEAVQ